MCLIFAIFHAKKVEHLITDIFYVTISSHSLYSLSPTEKFARCVSAFSALPTTPDCGLSAGFWTIANSGGISTTLIWFAKPSFHGIPKKSGLKGPVFNSAASLKSVTTTCYQEILLMNMKQKRIRPVYLFVQTGCLKDALFWVHLTAAPQPPASPGLGPTAGLA